MAKSKAAAARAATARAVLTLSPRLAALRSDWAWASRQVVDPDVAEISKHLAQAEILAFTLAQNIDSGRVELNLPDEPRPLFDRPTKPAEIEKPEEVASPARQTVEETSLPPGDDYEVKCNTCGWTKQRSTPGPCPSKHVSGFSLVKGDEKEDVEEETKKSTKGPSFDILADAPGEPVWVARIWADTSPDAWGLANAAFPSLKEKFRAVEARAKYDMEGSVRNERKHYIYGEMDDFWMATAAQISWEVQPFVQPTVETLIGIIEPGTSPIVLPQASPPKATTTTRPVIDGASVGLTIKAVESVFNLHTLRWEKGGSTIKKPLEIREKLYIPTGGLFTQGKKTYWLNELTRLEDWTGDASDTIRLNPKTGYAGLIVRHRDQKYVLGGRDTEVDLWFEDRPVQSQTQKPDDNGVQTTNTWRDILTSTLQQPLSDLCWDAEAETLGEAWDLLERGELVESCDWTPAQARLLEGVIVEIRHASGDPAPNTAPMPEEAEPTKATRKPPTKTFVVGYRYDDDEPPIELGRLSAKNFEEARASIPKAYAHESVRLPDGQVRKIDHDRVTIVQAVTKPRRKKGATANV